MKRCTGIDFHTDGFTAAAAAPIEGFPAERNLETGRNDLYPEGIADKSIETHGYALLDGVWKSAGTASMSPTPNDPPLKTKDLPLEAFRKIFKTVIIKR